MKVSASAQPAYGARGQVPYEARASAGVKEAFLVLPKDGQAREVTIEVRPVTGGDAQAPAGAAGTARAGRSSVA